MVPFLSHVRRCGAGGALVLTGIPPSPGKAIFLSGSGEVFGSVLDPVGIWALSVGFLGWPLREMPNRHV